MPKAHQKAHQKAHIKAHQVTKRDIERMDNLFTIRLLFCAKKKQLKKSMNMKHAKFTLQHIIHLISRQTLNIFFFETRLKLSLIILIKRGHVKGYRQKSKYYNCFQPPPPTRTF